MNGLIWILLLLSCGNNNGCGCAKAEEEGCREDRGRCEERERREDRGCCDERTRRDTTWTPFMSNSSNRDNDCGCSCEHSRS